MSKPQTTAQAVFDQVAETLLAQRQRSAGAEGGLYANGDLRCAVGFLLTSVQATDLEGLSVLDVRVQDALPFEANEEVVNVLDYLQRLHDRVDPSDWQRGLSAVAELTGLRMLSGQLARTA